MDGSQTRTGSAARHALRIGAAVVLVLAAGVGASALAVPGDEAPRGRMVEVEPGRSLRLVCAGPGDGPPAVWFESGAFGIAADWAVVQMRLAEAGVRSCAYDRAGLGYSDPGPKPRTADAVAADLDRLVSAVEVSQPVVLVAHSAGGLYARAFAARRPDLIRGVVLVDAMTPEAVKDRMESGFFAQFRRLSGWAAGAAAVGLMKPVALTGFADRIGLPPVAAREKRHAMGSARHNRAAADEVQAWREGVAQTLAEPGFDPDWPVAVVTAKREGDAAAFNQARAAPARQAKKGRVDTVEGADHTTLLGAYAGRIVEAIGFVSGAAPTEGLEPPTF